MKCRNWRLLFAIVLVVAVLLCALPMGVAADPPVRLRSPQVPGEWVSSCGFPMRWEVLQDNTYWTIFFDSQGNEVKWILNGILKGRLTRVDTGKSLEFNSGPFVLTLDQGTIWTQHVMGSNAWDWGPSPPLGLPNLMLLTGQLIYKVDVASGTYVDVVSVRGKVVDLCAFFAD